MASWSGGVDELMWAVEIVAQLLIVAAAVGWGAWCHWASQKERIRRALKGATVVAIRDLPESTPGRIVGRVTSGEPMPAPLSGRPCVYRQGIREPDAQAGDRE